VPGTPPALWRLSAHASAAGCPAACKTRARRSRPLRMQLRPRWTTSAHPARGERPLVCFKRSPCVSVVAPWRQARNRHGFQEGCVVAGASQLSGVRTNAHLP
jgi:hypothetical protein